MGRSLKRMHNHLANKDNEGAGYQVVITGWYKMTSLSFKQFNATELPSL